MLGGRLQCKGAELAQVLETYRDFLSLRFIYRDCRQAVTPAAMIQRRSSLRRQCRRSLRGEGNERERFAPAESWRHNGKVSSCRKKRCRVGPRLNGHFVVLGTKRNAERRSSGLPPANALPEPDWTDNLR